MHWKKAIQILIVSAILIIAVVGIIIQYQQLSKDLSNGCIGNDIGEPIKEVCIKEPSWYDTMYKKWEYGADRYIEKNLLWWWV